VQYDKLGVLLFTPPRLLLTSAEVFSGVIMAVSQWANANTAMLSAAILAGDRSAEQALVARLTPALRLMLRVSRIPIEDREDLLHDALIILLKRLRTSALDQADGVEAFVQATLHNLRVGEWRRSDRRQHLLHANAHDAEPLLEPPPDVRLESNAAGDLVRSAIDGLRQPRDQRLIREHYLKEVGKPELCSQFQITEAHFDRILYNARQRLKALLVSAGMVK
jgi:RNA polymerase sigma factor (sigma-70 family)